MTDRDPPRGAAPSLPTLEPETPDSRSEGRDSRLEWLVSMALRTAAFILLIPLVLVLTTLTGVVVFACWVVSAVKTTIGGQTSRTKHEDLADLHDQPSPRRS